MPHEVHNHNVLLLNPVLHTSTLYWACMFKNIDLQGVKNILENLEAYPEAPVMSDKWRTACHAAA